MPSYCCFFCGRSLHSPTIFFQGHAVGPVCATRHRILTGAATKKVTRYPNAPKPRPERDELTMDLFGGQDD